MSRLARYIEAVISLLTLGFSLAAKGANVDTEGWAIAISKKRVLTKNTPTTKDDKLLRNSLLRYDPELL
jgi:hypothetical protein